MEVAQAYSMLTGPMACSACSTLGGVSSYFSTGCLLKGKHQEIDAGLNLPALPVINLDSLPYTVLIPEA